VREKVELTTLSGGAAYDMFNEELKSIMENIQDVNTPSKTVRSITMTLKIRPSEDRLTAETELSVSKKIATIKPVVKSMFFSKDEENNLCAFEDNPKQQTLEFSVKEA